ncbi:MAG: NusG domain II-containing protein [Clostridia bacterium]|nr:NusG domain II-containing protein [Clostridia bacterium]
MEKQKNIRRAPLRNDVILVGVLLLLCAVGILYLFVLRESGNVVKVTVDGELYGVYSLAEDITEEIRSGENGSAMNRLIIRDGRAYMETASCPDGICVSHRPIFRNGESIVCLPNRVVVTVFTDDAADAPDIVA